MIRNTNAVLGNSELMVTLGKMGEILGFFYPRRDYAQHVEESMMCIYSDEFAENTDDNNNSDRLLWMNSSQWEHRQKYTSDSYNVSTELKHENGLEVSILDSVHPLMPALTRKFRISSKRDFEGKLFYYSSLNAGDMPKQNTCYCDNKEYIVVQYWQDYHLGLTSLPEFQSWQVSKIFGSSWWASPKYDMEDGVLQNNREDIGKLGSAIGWDMHIKKDEPFDVTIFMGASNNKSSLYRKMREARSQSIERINEQVQENCVKWLSRKRLLNIFEQNDHGLNINLLDIYNRSLLTLKLLNEPSHGSFIASPEFDPAFEMCGGYGFCWNRDAAEIANALLDSGYPEYAGKFFRWCVKTQLPDGSWFQRYWTDGRHGPSWSNFNSTTQIDETGSTLYAIGKYYETLEGIDKIDFIEHMWVTVLRGAEYLIIRTRNGLHDTCMDLWETHVGTFTYTNASIFAGLIQAARIADEYDQKELADRWKEHAYNLKEQILNDLWTDGGYFARGIMHDRLDHTIDASILGTITPFGLLSPYDPEERNKIYSLINTIENRLKIEVNDHFGIKRYEDDQYINGNPWVVTTLWLSKTMLMLSHALQKEGDSEQSRQILSRATSLIQWAVKGTTDTGLLPEQVDKDHGNPAWAIPLGWSCALMVDNIILLDEISRT